MNIRTVLVRLAIRDWATAASRPLRPQIRADYSGRGPNCNVARALNTAACGAATGPLRLRRQEPARCRKKPPGKQRPRRLKAVQRQSRARPRQNVRQPANAARRADRRRARAHRRRTCRRPRRRSRRPIRRRRRLRLASRTDGLRRCRASTASSVAAQGHRPRARHAGRKHRAFRQRPARQQRAALGRARHGQVVAGEGGACRRQRRRARRRAAEADRDPPRGHREPARADALLRGSRYRFIVFCDDLSFDADDTSYKSLKAVLEGGIEGRPDNVIFYATSNRRHLLPRDMIENERSTAINPGEAVEEKVSLSDRFGLWLGFHRCSQDEYLAMVDGYFAHFGISSPTRSCEREALEWATTRGSRSGRVAWQFIQDLAGRLGVRLAGQMRPSLGRRRRGSRAGSAAGRARAIAASSAHASLALMASAACRSRDPTLGHWLGAGRARSRRSHVTRGQACRKASACPLVRPKRIVSISAMPTAPPRLRIMLNRPLASGTCLCGNVSSASRVGGSRQNIAAKPRSTCGQNISSKSAVRLSNALMPRPTANSAKPKADSKRGSTPALQRDRQSARPPAGPTPVTSMIVPICKRIVLAAHRRGTPASDRPRRTTRRRGKS